MLPSTGHLTYLASVCCYSLWVRLYDGALFTYFLLYISFVIIVVIIIIFSNSSSGIVLTTVLNYKSVKSFPSHTLLISISSALSLTLRDHIYTQLSLVLIAPTHGGMARLS